MTTPTIRPPPPRHRHLPQLDALRAAAALAVFGFHLYTGAYAPTVGQGTFWRFIAGRHGLLAVAAFPLAFGIAGVPAFFLLSGFCIHLAHLRAGRPLAYGRFVWRRFWRLYPAYLAALAFAVVLANRRGVPLSALRWDVVAHVLLVHNLGRATFAGLNGSFWTLAIEWQFYLAYPVVLLAFARLGPSRATLAFAGLSLAAATLVTVGDTLDLVLLFNPVTLWVEWCLGAWVAHRFWTGNNRPAATAPLLIALVPAVYLTGHLGVGSSWASLCWAAAGVPVLEWLVCRDRRVPRAAVWVGTISYSVYLFHLPLVLWGVGREPTPGRAFALVLAVVLPATIGVGALSYYAIEKSGVRLGRAWLTTSA